MMDWTEIRLEIENVHSCFMLRTIPLSDALRTLKQLGIPPTRVTQLLCLWADERRIANIPSTGGPPGQPRKG